MLNHEPKSQNCDGQRDGATCFGFQCSTTSRRAKTKEHMLAPAPQKRFSAQPRAEEPKPHVVAWPIDDPKEFQCSTTSRRAKTKDVNGTPITQLEFQCSTTSRRAKTQRRSRSSSPFRCVSVLNHEPKSQNPRRARIEQDSGRKVSVLNHEPKSQNIELLNQHRVRAPVSVLNHEPKSQNPRPRIQEHSSRKVSVLNHEPKSQNLRLALRNFLYLATFQCSTTSRRAKTPRAAARRSERTGAVSVLNHEPKSQNPLRALGYKVTGRRFSAQPRAEEPKRVSINFAVRNRQSFSAQPRAEEPKPSRSLPDGSRSPVSVLNHEPKSQNPR